MLGRAFFVGLLIAAQISGQVKSPSQVYSNFGSGWGMGAYLLRDVPRDEVEPWLVSLHEAGILWSRDDSPQHTNTLGHIGDARERLLAMQKYGVYSLAIAEPPGQAQPQSGEFVSSDLGSVFSAARLQARTYGGLVHAYELSNEPDVGYFPEMHDRYAAHAKAMYLGLKVGARDAGLDVPVLNGALALTPGPWLERAARCGVLDYADAWNVHYYGHADGLTPALNSFAESFRELPKTAWYKASACAPASDRPIWVTEYGSIQNRSSDLHEKTRRALQAVELITVAKEAYRNPQLAMFMPYVLYRPNDPRHSLTRGLHDPYSAWTAYAEFTRQNTWPSDRPLWGAAIDPNPVVLQWCPDLTTTIPHKVAGTYRWRSKGKPIRGVFRVWNFGDEPVRGCLVWDAPWKKASAIGTALGSGEQGVFSKQISVPPNGGVTTLDLMLLSPAGTDWFREYRQVWFVDQHSRSSSLYFGVERHPAQAKFELSPLVNAADTRVSVNSKQTGPRSQLLLTRQSPDYIKTKVSSDDFPKFPLFGDYRLNGRSGPWLRLNECAVDLVSDEKIAYGPTKSPKWRFGVNRLDDDFIYPPQAIARVSGLPQKALLRLQLDRAMTRQESLRVDLLDTEGRRFTIFEALGRSYFEPSEEQTSVWLALEDFHPFFWGKITSQRRLVPIEVVEVQVRPMLAEGHSLTVRIDVCTPQ
jgi:hypothetical protein